MAVPQRVAERDVLFEARAKQHIRETHNPESLMGLSWSRALREQPFIFVFDFHLKPEKRPDRREAPCPLCSPKSPKYYHGSLAWFPVEGVYRCIGNECAGHFIGKDEATAARKQFVDT